MASRELNAPSWKSTIVAISHIVILIYILIDSGIFSIFRYVIVFSSDSRLKYL